nr:uncharacterized protein CTRU02_14223 [Colletotrichum truncatum]KAF6782446.1 hypothetical protein CTRU02_14223 [Colletotrichum truncatum]
MSLNRIAVYGHRGWATARIVAALIDSGAAITVLHRAESDTSNIPAGVPKIEVDVFDEDALVKALQSIDIVLSLVGDRDVDKEHGFVKAIPRTNVKLFVPSDLGLQYGEEGNLIPIIKQKDDLQRAVRDAGIPMTRILIGNFAEFTLGCCAMGVDLGRNRIVHTINSAQEKANMTTRDYVGAGYASIFTSNDISQIQNRTITLSELAPTGDEIAAAMTQKNGAEPEVFTHSREKVQKAFEDGIRAGELVAPAWFYRKIWGTGELMKMLSSDVWDVPGYQKATLHHLIVEEKIEAYRDLPLSIAKYLEDDMF